MIKWAFLLVGIHNHMTFATDLYRTRAELLAKIEDIVAAITANATELSNLTLANAKPSYSLDGESVDFNGFHNALTQRLGLLNGELDALQNALKTINEILSMQPYEIQSRMSL